MFAVVKNGHYCSLLEVVDRSRTGTSVTRLLQELESNRVVGSAHCPVLVPYERIYASEHLISVFTI